MFRQAGEDVLRRPTSATGEPAPLEDCKTDAEAPCKAREGKMKKGKRERRGGVGRAEKRGVSPHLRLSMTQAVSESRCVGEERRGEGREGGREGERKG